ncbi:methyltransferase [Porphyromonadaceae bacterium COT-184 OH4590]|nr:methyltransferase [Porphyromonadaceae bacterium COT-184 OH4590]
MYLNSSLAKRYTKENFNAVEAQRSAHEIAQGPIVFQVSRLMIKYRILQLLIDSENGLTINEIVQKTNLSEYAVKILIESSLSIGTVLYDNGKFLCSKTGWFLLNDPAVRVNIDFNHDVNYLGMYNLEESLLNGKPEGLKIFGSWPTIYEGLSSLPEQVQKSWFGFDHFYSDGAFEEAFNIVFADKPCKLLDVGGNTGKWALYCIEHDEEVEITIMDLPQQITLMKQNMVDVKGIERIHGHGCNMLSADTAFPEGFDAIWFSQFLDCFSEAEITSILSRAYRSMTPKTKIYIMETLWDRQRFETASYVLTQTSVYFTAMANGNSKMYHSEDLIRCIEKSNLVVEDIYDGIGVGHSIIRCGIK